MNSETALQKVESDQIQPATILNIIAAAAQNPNMDVEKMERLLAMHERVTAKQSEQAFNDAMAECQKEMPHILKDRKNSSTNSTYAQLETVNRVIVPIYTKHGFSLSFGTAESNLKDHYRVTCIVTRSGFSRQYNADVPIDNVGMKGTPNKTATHGFGSTMSYGRRYLTMLIFNLSVTDDDDGNTGKTQPQQGPSSQAAADLSVDELRKKLWNILAPIAGPARDWNERNEWLYSNDLLDPMAETNNRAPNLTAAKYTEVITKAETILKK